MNNILVIGATQFTQRIIDAIEKLPAVKICGIISNEEHFTISYAPQSGVKNIRHANMQTFCEQNAVPFYLMQKNMNEPALLDFVQQQKPNGILVAGWYHLVPKSIRDQAPTLGLHASLLPKYRGGAPLVWAIINDEPETGITLFKMDEGVDTGDIAGQKRVPIQPEDTIKTLYEKIENASISLIQETFPKLANNTLNWQPQDHSNATLVPQRSPKDGLINWQWPAKKIYNFIRAQTKPYPGAFTIINEKQLSIWQSAYTIKKHQKSPGNITLENKMAHIYTHDGFITPTQVSYEDCEISFFTFCTKHKLTQVI